MRDTSQTIVVNGFKVLVQVTGDCGELNEALRLAVEEVQEMGGLNGHEDWITAYFTAATEDAADTVQEMIESAVSDMLFREGFGGAVSANVTKAA
jgi:hypothetical protein